MYVCIRMYVCMFYIFKVVIEVDEGGRERVEWGILTV